MIKRIFYVVLLVIGGVSLAEAGTWSQTSQSDFESDTLTNIDTTTVPGSIGVIGAYRTDSNTRLLLHFNETSGTTTVTDFSGNGNNGTLLDSAGGDTTPPNARASGNAIFPAGEFNNGLQFDGANDFVSVPDNTLILSNPPYTIELWIKPNVDLSSGLHPLLTGYNVSYQYLRGAFCITFGGQIWARIFGGAGSGFGAGSSGDYQINTPSLTWNINEWYHVVFTFTNTEGKIYRNGVLVGSATGSFVAADNINITTLGSKQSTVVIMGGGLAYFNGVIDELRISNVVKTSFPLSYFSQGTIVSPKINTSANNISAVKISATAEIPSGTSIEYYASNDGGVTWVSISKTDAYVTMPSSGQTKYNDLKIKTILYATGSSTSVLSEWRVDWKEISTTPSKRTFNPGESGEVISSDDQSVKITIPGSAINKRTSFSITRQLSLFEAFNEPKNAIVGYEFKAEDETGKDILSLDDSVTITLHAISDGIYIIDSNPKINLSDADRQLVIGFWDGRNWIPLTSTVSVNGYDVTVSAKTRHLTTFAIVIKPSAGISLKVYPNPFTPNSSDSRFNRVNFTFENKDNEVVEIKIWDPTGTLVKAITDYSGTSTISWDGRNEYGEVCESGVYIYQIKIGNNKVGRGTIVIAK